MIKQTLLDAAQAGAAELKRYFNNPQLKTAYKDGAVNDLVTEADHAADRAIIGVIRAQFPNDFILSEETGNVPTNSAVKWIIDPIDGTINYAHGIPICCVSIGVEKDGDMIMGVVYNPFLNELFFAEKGQGAFLNGERITVSTQTQVVKSCLVTGFPYTYIDAHNGPLQCFERFIRQGIPVRRLGSAAVDLCWVACGRFDGFYEHKLNAWDSAAGYLMVLEAGGTVTDYAGQPYSPYQPHILATNGHIHADMLAVINNEKTL
ncbi:MAG: inositol monophosphatase [Bacteroidetes bacterium]|nr:MAG: inositol monophosphatase [Bacteroidota bacterium]